MERLRDVFEQVEGRRKRFEVFTDSPEIVTELQRQFETRSVDVEHRPTTGFEEPGYVVVRGSDGEFQGALDLDQFDAVLSPEIHPPWVLADSEVETSELFDFLENTVFTSYDRRQMLATAREIEERAWRVGSGTLLAGFQRERALADQAAVYERLADRETLSVTVFIDDEWDDAIDGVDVVSETDSEIGRFWFVIFGGGEEQRQSCALLAEERHPGQYYGFWTYDPALVLGVIDYLESNYDV